MPVEPVPSAKRTKPRLRLPPRLDYSVLFDCNEQLRQAPIRITDLQVAFRKLSRA